MFTNLSAQSMHLMVQLAVAYACLYYENCHNSSVLKIRHQEKLAMQFYSKSYHSQMLVDLLVWIFS